MTNMQGLTGSCLKICSVWEAFFLSPGIEIDLNLVQASKQPLCT